MKSFALTFAAMLALAGCSSSSTGSGVPIARFADAQCDQILACDSDRSAIARGLVASGADCRALLETVIRSEFDIQAYLDDGTVRIDRGNLSDCMSAIAADPCVPTDRIPACDQVFVGTLAEGASCSSDIQCASDACTAGPGQCGTCLAPAAVGASCDPVADNCAASPDGFVDCVSDGMGGGTCVLEPSNYLTVALGASCNGAGGVRRYCASPYYCDASELCAERTAVGSPCDPDFDECAFGSICADAPGGPTCLAVVVVTTANDPCGELPSGALARCDRSERLYCGENGQGDLVCLPLAGTGGENSDCFVASDCDSGLVCVIGDFVETPGTCETTGKQNGAACDIDAECASQFCRFDLTADRDICQALPTCP